MTKYIVCMEIINSGTLAYNKIYQYYLVGKKNLETLKKFNMMKEGGCCCDSGCIACLLGGFDVKYHSHKKIKNDSDMAIAKYVCRDQFYELEEFLYPENNDWCPPHKT